MKKFTALLMITLLAAAINEFQIQSSSVLSFICTGRCPNLYDIKLVAKMLIAFLNQAKLQ